MDRDSAPKDREAKRHYRALTHQVRHAILPVCAEEPVVSQKVQPRGASSSQPDSFLLGYLAAFRDDPLGRIARAYQPHGDAACVVMHPSLRLRPRDGVWMHPRTATSPAQ
jgi:hypothetical protein